MIDRIQKILEEKDLTASQLAGIIGVQPSSMSHVLSGRNKPSLDFIQKILKSFPDINSDWLLFGKNQMKVKKEATLFDISEEKDVTSDQKRKSDVNILDIDKKSDVTNVKSKTKKLEEENSNKESSRGIEKQKSTDKNLSRKAKRVLILYNGNTFDGSILRKV